MKIWSQPFPIAVAASFAGEEGEKALKKLGKAELALPLRREDVRRCLGNSWIL